MVLWLEARGVRPGGVPRVARGHLPGAQPGRRSGAAGGRGERRVDAGVMAPLLALVVAGYALGAVGFRRLDRERFSRWRWRWWRARAWRAWWRGWGSCSGCRRPAAHKWRLARGGSPDRGHRARRCRPRLSCVAQRRPPGRSHRRRPPAAARRDGLAAAGRMRTCVRSWSSASSTPASSCSRRWATAGRCSPSRSRWRPRRGASRWWGRCPRRPRRSAWCGACGWARRCRAVRRCG